MNDMLRRTAGVAGFAALLGLAACDASISPQFEVDGTGTVEGLLYFDADNDELFDPSDGDAPVAGVGVAVRVRDTDAVIASGTTGEDGRFSIQNVIPGTHDVFFDESSVPDGVFVCENPVRATVTLDAPSFVGVPSRGACLVPIIDVQTSAGEGDFVIVRGIVTASPSQFDESDMAIQDETGGIWFFTGALDGLGIEVGDVIEVGGTVSLPPVAPALQLVNVSLREVVPDAGTVVPQETTTGAIAATGSLPRDPLQNRLAVIRAAELTSAFNQGGGRNATMDDGSGSTIIRVESVLSPNSEGGILTTTGMTVGNCYDVTGIVAGFFGTAQIFPRTVADIVEVPCS
jgi:hypothetical protein